MGKNVLKRVAAGLLVVACLAMPLLGAPVLLMIVLALLAVSGLIFYFDDSDTADARAGPSGRWLQSERRSKKSKKSEYYHANGWRASRSRSVRDGSYQESPHLGMASKGMRATATHLAGSFRSFCRKRGRASGSRSYLHVRESALGLSPG